MLILMDTYLWVVDGMKEEGQGQADIKLLDTFNYL